MRRKTLFLICFLLISGLLIAENYNTAMGLHFGTSTGNGYSYRKWGDAGAFQVTFAAYSTGDRNPDWNDSDFINRDYKDARKNSISLGMNYLWDLLQTEKYRFYLMTGTAYTYRKVKRFTDPNTSSWERVDRWAIGVGPGFELEFSDRFHFSIEIPMTYNHNDDIIPYIPSVGFYYYFK